MSRVRTSIELYRAATDQPGSERRSTAALEYLMAIGEAKPKSSEEAEIKLQFLLGEEVSQTTDSEVYSKLVMQAYLQRLMFDF